MTGLSIGSFSIEGSDVDSVNGPLLPTNTYISPAGDFYFLPNGVDYYLQP